MRIFLGVNLGLGFSNFSLGNYIPDRKGVLGSMGIGFILCLFLLFLLFLRFPFCLRSHHSPVLLFFNPC